MTGGRVISENAINSEKPRKPSRAKRWYKRWWAWCLWIFLAFLLILTLIGLWAWTQRYDLMESRAIKIFSDAGFEAELDIVAVTQSNAQVNNIRLRREGEEFLRIDKLSADYVWPDIRDGKFTQIEFEGVAGRLELGEDWTPAKDWYSEFLPSGSGGGAESEFPEKGIRLTDVVLTLSLIHI